MFVEFAAGHVSKVQFLSCPHLHKLGGFCCRGVLFQRVLFQGVLFQGGFFQGGGGGGRWNRAGICIDQLHPPPPRHPRRVPPPPHRPPVACQESKVVVVVGGAFVILGENPLLSDSDRRGFLLRVERQLRVKF